MLYYHSKALEIYIWHNAYYRIYQNSDLRKNFWGKKYSHIYLEPLSKHPGKKVEYWSLTLWSVLTYFLKISKIIISIWWSLCLNLSKFGISYTEKSSSQGNCTILRPIRFILCLLVNCKTPAADWGKESDQAKTVAQAWNNLILETFWYIFCFAYC